MSVDLGLQAGIGLHALIKRWEEIQRRESGEGNDDVAVQKSAPLDSKVPGSPEQDAAMGTSNAGKTDFACGRNYFVCQ